MATCEYRTSCVFLNKMVVDSAHTTDDLRDKYCNGEFSKCARLIIYKYCGDDYVPDNLSPDSLNRQQRFL